MLLSYQSRRLGRNQDHVWMWLQEEASSCEQWWHGRSWTAIGPRYHGVNAKILIQEKKINGDLLILLFCILLILKEKLLWFTDITKTKYRYQISKKGLSSVIPFYVNHFVNSSQNNYPRVLTKHITSKRHDRCCTKLFLLSIEVSCNHYLINL